MLVSAAGLPATHGQSSREVAAKLCGEVVGARRLRVDRVGPRPASSSPTLGQSLAFTFFSPKWSDNDNVSLRWWLWGSW